MSALTKSSKLEGKSGTRLPPTGPFKNKNSTVRGLLKARSLVGRLILVGGRTNHKARLSTRVENPVRSLLELLGQRGDGEIGIASRHTEAAMIQVSLDDAEARTLPLARPSRPSSFIFDYWWGELIACRAQMPVARFCSSWESILS